MKIYTSYFAKLKDLPDNIVPISICGKAPDWYTGLQYKVLAPKWSFFKIWKYKTDGMEDCFQNNDFYIKKFKELVTDTLDVNNVITRLSELSEGQDIALICYEKSTDFCHRHLVAKWLKDNGIECNEYIFNAEGKLFKNKEN